MIALEALVYGGLLMAANAAHGEAMAAHANSLAPMGLLEIAHDACNTASRVEMDDLDDNDPAIAPVRAYYEAAWKQGKTKGVLHASELLNLGDLTVAEAGQPADRVISYVAMNDAGGALQTSCAVHFGSMPAPTIGQMADWSGAKPSERLFPRAWNEAAWDLSPPEGSEWEQATVSLFASERTRPSNAKDHPFSGLLVRFSKVDF